jgi:hypothetical protein
VTDPCVVPETTEENAIAEWRTNLRKRARADETIAAAWRRSCPGYLAEHAELMIRAYRLGTSRMRAQLAEWEPLCG